MTQAVVASSTVVGVQATAVEVQVDVASGLPAFAIVGLGDAAVMEARERVRAALRSSGYDFPNARVTVNLAPSPVRKHGTGFDLPIALGILLATGQVPRESGAALTVGELALDGRVRAVPGLLAHAMAAARDDRPLLIATEGLSIVASVPGVSAHPIERLSGLRAGLPTASSEGPREAAAVREDSPDLAQVHGQPSAKRALEIAAAGGLGVLFVGPPGSGKTMLARRLPGILPPMSPSESLETAVVHSVAGLEVDDLLSGLRPFRAPHHTATTAGLVGGGSPPGPGEASLAHNGVLFLDEVPQFSPSALQALRQPLEDGTVTLVRAEGRIRYPAKFSLVAAMNPCPCGFLGDAARPCTCPPPAVERYRSRIGGPLMDRIDMTLRVDRVDPACLLVPAVDESSGAVRERVMRARTLLERLPGGARSSGSQLLRSCALDAHARRTVERAADVHRLSGRGVTRLLRVSRTIAALAGCDRVDQEHILEASSFRALS